MCMNNKYIKINNPQLIRSLSASISFSTFIYIDRACTSVRYIVRTRPLDKS